MNQKQWATIATVLALGVHTLSLGQARTPAVDRDAPIVFTIDRPQGRLQLGIKPNPLPGKDVMWGLSELYKSRGPTYPVIVLLDSRAEVADLVQAGILAKVGFTNVREFVAYRDKGIMAEISFGPATPIVGDPAQPRAD